MMKQSSSASATASFRRNHVDPQARRIVLQAHTSDEYTRIELLKGSLMPDFAFTDFEERERRISDYRGKYLLIEFWGSWCPPCVAEFPHLKKAYEKYRERGLEIVRHEYRDDGQRTTSRSRPMGITRRS
jgi:thiol-disulfide isomerase/thioredoxin